LLLERDHGECNSAAALPDALCQGPGCSSRPGGLHAAGLFTAEGELVPVREEVGRYNAVDKVVGWAPLDGRLLLHRHPADGQRALQLRDPAEGPGRRHPCGLRRVGASSLVVDLARRFGMTLVRSLRGVRFNVTPARSASACRPPRHAASS
jgi:FdhD protein